MTAPTRAGEREPVARVAQEETSRTAPAVQLSNVLLVVPTLNEEEGLPGVLAEARRIGVPTLVLDGGSSDRTCAIAELFGVPVFNGPRGKGRAWREFLRSPNINDWTWLAMVDGDGTYDLTALPGMVASGTDMVIGVRSGVPGETPRFRALGARGLSMLAGLVTRTRCPDLLSGFRVFSVDSLRSVRLSANGFELEAELTVEYIRRGMRVAWVPVAYRRRRGRSKLRPVREGLRIVWAIFRVRFRQL